VKLQIGVDQGARLKTYGCGSAIADYKSKRGSSAEQNAPVPAQQVA